MHIHSFNFEELNITPEAVVKDLGYRRNSKPDEYILDMVNSLLNEISTITKPQCAFKIFEGELYPTEVILNNTTKIESGEIITQLLKGSTRFSLFVATAGKEFQNFFDELNSRNDMVEIFIADTIGSLIAEKTGDCMEQLLKKEIGQDKHTNRFSPGYCGWHLSNQREIFNLMGDETCGVTISEVFLMHPIKSISGIIGIGKEVNEKNYGCKFCELETCYKRKK